MEDCRSCQGKLGRNAVVLPHFSRVRVGFPEELRSCFSKGSGKGVPVVFKSRLKRQRPPSDKGGLCHCFPETAPPGQGKGTLLPGA
jgi:hypothetical protein